MKYLIVNPFGIGDVLFTTALVNALAAGEPKAGISYWCNERVKDILEDNPAIERVFALSRGDLKTISRRSKIEGFRQLLRLARDLKRARFDCAFDFSQDHRYGLLLKLLGVPKRIGFNYKNRGCFLTDAITISGFSGKHVARYYSQLLKFSAIADTHSGLTLCVADAARIKADQILAEAGILDGDVLVGVAAGAGGSWGKDAALKHWPAVNFAQLANMIRNQLGAKIILLGDETERLIAKVIMQTAGPDIYDLVGKTSLKELAAVLARLNLLVANDGGPLHMAAALGVKTVSLFGPVDERVYGPYPPSPAHIVITHKVACRPCYQNFRLPPCPNDRVCIRGIGVDEVMAAVRSLLML